MEEQRGLVAQILPKTLVGLAAWLVVFAAGSAFSGVLFFFYYRAQIERVESRVETFAESFQDDFETSKKEFDELVKSGKAEIEKASGGAGSQTNQLTKLLEKVGPSIALVSGADASGAPRSGSGFVVTSDANESWILTSYQIVAGAAATKTPVRIRAGGAEKQANVWSWDEGRDMALVIIKVGGLRAIEWAKELPAVGSPIWAVGAAPGQFGAAASSGYLTDSSETGVLIDAGVGAYATGGPLLDKEGKVLGMLSLSYAPAGYPPSNGWAVPIRLACQRVLRCPS